MKREREKTKKEKRKEKREKKHKKEKSREDGEIKKKELSHEKKHKSDKNVGDSLKRSKEVETEQLEKSCLTEDLGQPTSSQNLYDSSDSTQNSNKRKKHISPSDSSRTLGSSILIRLPLQKHKSPELPTSKEQVCSVSGRNEIVANEKEEISSRTCKQQSCSTAGRNEIQDQDTIAVTVPSTCLSKNGPRGVDLQFRDLIDNWVPPTMQIERMDFDDQEWLFEMKPQQRHEAKRFKPSDSDFCHRSAGWPRACYLPVADIYALPYTLHVGKKIQVAVRACICLSVIYKFIFLKAARRGIHKSIKKGDESIKKEHIIKMVTLEGVRVRLAGCSL
ncbi:hypothetical protein BVC80_9053g2 [Macleaya cordata]|uniref:Uncharacterized protein n=1 Tax=Macleaya cordata TaxID=56857 RepID=A0A200RA58_MACCD|nr:hypothetical protein BVC80_9053g2 [Macleaya cordata]